MPTGNDGLKYRGGMDEPEPADDPSEESDEFAQAASEAFPDEDWTPDRLAALKEAIRICASADYKSDDADVGGGDEGKKGLMALLFAKPKKE